MEGEYFSRTAQITAYCRWHHALHDRPLIFEDRLAGQILSEEERQGIEKMLLQGLERVNPQALPLFPDGRAAISWMMQAGASAPIVLARARYAEQMLEQAVETGTEQYVILGAGLDTFAFRRPDLMAKLTVIEVDHPATQAYKRDRIARLGWTLPPNLHFVPVDFTRQELPAELQRAPFVSDQGTFFSWLGVSYYLATEQVRGTLRGIAALASPGSRLVFDYLDCVAYQPAKAAPRVVRMLEGVREIGEPMLSGFDAGGMAEMLSECGLKLRENLGPSQIQQRYFLGRSDHHRACEHVHFALAEKVVEKRTSRRRPRQPSCAA